MRVLLREPAAGELMPLLAGLRPLDPEEPVDEDAGADVDDEDEDEDDAPSDDVLLNEAEDDGADVDDKDDVAVDDDVDEDA